MEGSEALYDSYLHAALFVVGQNVAPRFKLQGSSQSNG